MDLNSVKTWIKIITILFLLISVPLFFLSKSDEKNNNNEYVEKMEELYVEQIYFKNIEELDDLSIDQSLKFQDELAYYFKDLKVNVEEVEIIKDSLEKIDENKYIFKVKYEDKNLDVFINKDKVDIIENN